MIKEILIKNISKLVLFHKQFKKKKTYLIHCFSLFFGQTGSYTFLCIVWIFNSCIRLGIRSVRFVLIIIVCMCGNKIRFIDYMFYCVLDTSRCSYTKFKYKELAHIVIK